MASGKKPSSAHSSAAPSRSRGPSWARIAASRASRFGRVQHIQPDGHRGAVPAGRAAAGDQVPAGRGPGQQRRDVGRVGHVVQDQQPPLVGGQPLHRPFPQRLQRQHPGQRRLQRDSQGRQPGVDVGRGGGGDPPGQRCSHWRGRRPSGRPGCSCRSRLGRARPAPPPRPARTAPHPAGPAPRLGPRTAPAAPAGSTGPAGPPAPPTVATPAPAGPSSAPPGTARSRHHRRWRRSR